MPFKIREIKAKSILNKSTISDYTLNCYRGCQHACTYCYAKYISYYTGHKEPWGTYVDVKINAPEILQKEAKKKNAELAGNIKFHYDEALLDSGPFDGYDIAYWQED